MQLKNKKNINQLLALATCSLLGDAAITDVKAEEVDDWKVNTAVLFYAEDDDRVTAIETVTNLTKQVKEDETWSLRLTTDTLTGASPNGATASDIAQTFTSASGNNAYTTPAGAIPLDHEFRDTRIGLDGNWSKRWSELLSSDFGFTFSNEYDYRSVGINGMLSFDTNQKNRTWQAGFAYADDSIDPVGGVPIPLLMRFPPDPSDILDGNDGYGSSESKTTLDVILGVTQVFGKNTLGQFTYSYSDIDGYQNDPYKLISVVDGDTGSTLFYLNESRPDTRQKHSIYAGLKHLTANKNVFSPSIRYFTDDWGIDSFTVNMKYRFNLNDKQYIEPHVRYYSQSAADFYNHSLVNIDGITDTTADYRLAEFDAMTIGAKFGHTFENDSKLEVRLEYYSQNGDDNPIDAIGVQRGLDLFADVNAVILQFNYSISW